MEMVFRMDQNSFQNLGIHLNSQKDFYKIFYLDFLSIIAFAVTFIHQYRVFSILMKILFSANNCQKPN